MSLSMALFIVAAVVAGIEAFRTKSLIAVAIAFLAAAHAIVGV